MTVTRTRLVAVLVGALLAVAAGLSICLPMLHASHDAQALRTEAASIHAPSFTAPHDMVVPSHAPQADWRLEPVVGLGPATADLPSAPAVEAGHDLHGPAHAGLPTETLRTRAPPA